MFELTKAEWDTLRCKNCTLNGGRGILSDQNDINEETAMQLELINQSLAELQMKKTREEKPRNPIGFIQPKK